ncbi:Hypothetical Protein FCC1311_062632 [Hondaea fermentalgiana]|uniref:Uncharacterized protein n=1 Tax=Hondaea fermentalgiana TaxID=2315210 RepID=A0A2R5GN49_9STRA|nr:Hypothetical Protein FCC1311_062632 [Hondaea fermentalgiana]|eukprot:GBG30043.1 Hypothetical Protein FCC1311_062632 [Hondaea fermentalgiana]
MGILANKDPEVFARAFMDDAQHELETSRKKGSVELYVADKLQNVAVVARVLGGRREHCGAHEETHALSDQASNLATYQAAHQAANFATDEAAHSKAYSKAYRKANAASHGQAHPISDLETYAITDAPARKSKNYTHDDDPVDANLDEISGLLEVANAKLREQGLAHSTPKERPAYPNKTIEALKTTSAAPAAAKPANDDSIPATSATTKQALPDNKKSTAYYGEEGHVSQAASIAEGKDATNDDEATAKKSTSASNNANAGKSRASVLENGETTGEDDILDTSDESEEPVESDELESGNVDYDGNGAHVAARNRDAQKGDNEEAGEEQDDDDDDNNGGEDNEGASELDVADDEDEEDETSSTPSKFKTAVPSKSSATIKHNPKKTSKASASSESESGEYEDDESIDQGHDKFDSILNELAEQVSQKNDDLQLMKDDDHESH